MGTLQEIEMPIDLAENWPKFLENEGFELKEGPTLRELGRTAISRHPGISFPEPSDVECNLFRYVLHTSGSVTISIVGLFDKHVGAYVIDVRASEYARKDRRYAHALVEKIEAILCENGGTHRL